MSKKRTKKIQDYNATYSLLHRYVSFAFNQSYRKILHVGKENIPQDGAIIFAPNHTNTLMDALVILAYNHGPKVFVARADIFKFPILAKIFTFMKIMPIMRQRDGYKAVKKNQDTIDRAVDVLKDKIPFCIFPEGTHQAKYSSLPLSKGILKIAFQAHEQMPEVPLYIVPVGIRYGDFFRFRSTVRMEFGKPINVGAFIAENDNLTPQEQMNSMRNLLAERLHATIFHIPNNEDYEATYEICNAVEPYEIAELLKDKSNQHMHSLEVQFQANNRTLKRIEAWKESDPEKTRKLLELGKEAYKIRKKKGIDVESASVKKPLVSRIGRILLTLITLPYTLPVSMLASPTAGICQFIFTKLKDPAFRNSVRFVTNLVVWPLLVLIYAIIAFCLLPWQWAVVVTLLITPAPIVAHEVWKTVRLTVSDIKLLKEKKLQKIYSKIRETIRKK
jgi:1-acyl-sn-glycerol-3-phosphate acyltransferase